MVRLQRFFTFIVSYNIVSYNIVSYNIVSYNIVSYNIVSYKNKQKSTETIVRV